MNPMPQSADPMPAIVARLKQLVADLDVRLMADEIGETTFLFEGGVGLDSYAVVELIGAIEAAFAFEFPEAELTPDSFHDIRTLAAVVGRNLRCSG